jgi:nitrogen fixation protein
MVTATLVLSTIVKLAIVVLGAIYGRRVLNKYAIAGPHYLPKLDLEEPGRSIEQFLVWGGVRLLDLLIRMLGVVWQALLEASADVGEWFVTRELRKHRVSVELPWNIR